MIKQINSIISSLDSRDVNYCHWKSNEKIQQTLEGKTDLDVLCHRNDQQVFREILREHGFVKLEDVIFTGYPGIENYIGYDPETGRCIHIHLHFELTFGTPFLKEYVTPWGSYVLERKIADPKLGIPTTDPTTELFLLIVRYSMKVRRYNPLARRSYFEGFLEEYDWLVERADLSELETIALDLLNRTAAMHIKKLVDTSPTMRDLIRVGKSVRSELNVYSTYSSWSTIPIALLRKGFRGVGKLNRDFLKRPYPSRRKIQNRGLEIALIGIDGSGKSTHICSLHKWLSWKADVHSVYFGSGDGPSSFLRYPLKVLNKIRSRFKKRDSANQGNESVNKNSISGYSNKSGQNKKSTTDTNVGLAKAIWAVILAREKQKKRRRAIRARNKGMFVLMDRYPQNQFNDINDGPLLQAWNNSRVTILQRIAAWERKIYADLENNSPDLVIKLKTNPELAKDRKSGTPMSKLEYKSKIIDSVEYKNSRVRTIDTNQDIENVLDEIKNEIWIEM